MTIGDSSRLRVRVGCFTSSMGFCGVQKSTSLLTLNLNTRRPRIIKSRGYAAGFVRSSGDWRFRDCAWAGFSSYGSGFQGCGFKFEGGDLVKQTYTVKFPESPITPNKGIYLRL